MPKTYAYNIYIKIKIEKVKSIVFIKTYVKLKNLIFGFTVI